MSDQITKSLLDAAPLAQLLVQPDERISAANGLALDLLGRGILERHYITALRQPDLLDCIERVLSGRSNTAEALYLASRARGDVTYRVLAASVDLESGRGILVSFVDITDLQAAVQMRRDFVANVSHELRTPLTALLGFIETLRGAAKADADARDRFLSIMDREATRMNRLVRDLLSLSKVEADERLQPAESVDVAGLVKTAVSALAPVAEEASVTIHAQGTGEPRLVKGDHDQLSQVVANLLENAVKYGASGGAVWVDLDVDEANPVLRAPAVTISVTDKGEGFDPIHIPRLTERFYRVDPHRSREMGGTGLGLAIVKHIVNRHRGRLRIETAPGEGSRFSVILPLA